LEGDDFAVVLPAAAGSDAKVVTRRLREAMGGDPNRRQVHL
jgi:GGDEF domain-containing protein